MLHNYELCAHLGASANQDRQHCKLSSVQFSPLTDWVVGATLHEGRFSRDAFPVFSAGGHGSGVDTVLAK